MPFVIRLWRLGGSPMAPKPHAKTAALADAVKHTLAGKIDDMLGEYLQSFDVEAHDGRGEANFTTDIARRCGSRITPPHSRRGRCKAKNARSDLTVDQTSH